MSKTPEGFREKIAYLDEFGQRLGIIPADVSGFWRNWRSIVQAVLILFFLIIPWTEMNGTQTVLIDLVNRQFSFFGLRFWSHDAPLFFLVLASAAIILALATALFGRIWCGWACPQTVFIDGVFRRIERWLEGNHLARRRALTEPMTFSLAVRKTIKWIAYVLVSALITHSFLAYFVGSEKLLEMVQRDPSENWAAFTFILASTGIVLFDLAWFKEQFCLIVCPYGRFQSVLHDRDTVTVQYDAKRGEPRKGVAEKGKEGDCVDCKRCVQVCPTGIDIRNGVQMECIACTGCIDACDEIMQKVNKPKGLIRYMPTVERKPKWFRSRVLLYAVILVLLLGTLATLVARRNDFSAVILKSKDLPYFVKETERGPVIVNSYRLHIHNESNEKLSRSVQLADKSNPAVQLQIPFASIELKPSEFRMIPFIIEVNQAEMPGSGRLPVKLTVGEINYEVEFVGPRH